MVLAVFSCFPVARFVVAGFDVTARGSRSIVNYIEHQYFTFIVSYLGLYDRYSPTRLLAAVVILVILAQIFMSESFFSLVRVTLEPPLDKLHVFRDPDLGAAPRGAAATKL
mmetsp:Transcript_6963/g.18224  ORF Transcript_6963/g.18224 Transcript_6963/m.18224 type:complete len:111 (+) Transcript_6963:1-333(+)